MSPALTYRPLRSSGQLVVNIRTPQEYPLRIRELLWMLCVLAVEPYISRDR